jgi:hypothetical protein
MAPSVSLPPAGAELAAFTPGSTASAMTSPCVISIRIGDQPLAGSREEFQDFPLR